MKKKNHQDRIYCAMFWHEEHGLQHEFLPTRAAANKALREAKRELKANEEEWKFSPAQTPVVALPLLTDKESIIRLLNCCRTGMEESITRYPVTALVLAFRARIAEMRERGTVTDLKALALKAYVADGKLEAQVWFNEAVGWFNAIRPGKCDEAVKAIYEGYSPLAWTALEAAVKDFLRHKGVDGWEDLTP